MNIRTIKSCYFKLTEFEVDKEKKKNGHCKSGRVRTTLKIKLNNDKETERECIFPIRSLYVDPHSNDAIECFSFPKSSALSGVLSLVKEMGYIKAGAKAFTFIDGCLHYSNAPGQEHLIDSNDGTGIKTVYYSKQSIFTSILSEIRIKRPVVGLDSMNFNRIPDQFLEVCGFNKLEDYFGHLKPLWYGRISDIFNLDSMYSEEAISKRLNSFVDSLKKMISDGKKNT